MYKALIVFLLLLLSHFVGAQSFETSQLRNSRVSNAKVDKQWTMEQACSRYGMDYNNIVNVYIRAFKQERILELWVQGDFDSDYIKIKEYAFCEMSGYLGPKRKRGDRQIPEGFYFVNKFNPTSNYHLSLGINYPNPSDSKLSVYPNLGGDIFIHGDCITIGCIPLTDDKIKELYLICVKARNNGQSNIPVHIFPNKFDESTPKTAYNGNLNDPLLLHFWDNIQEGYYYFERHRRPPLVHINSDGTYEFF